MVRAVACGARESGLVLPFVFSPGQKVARVRFVVVVVVVACWLIKKIPKQKRVCKQKDVLIRLKKEFLRQMKT